MPSKNRTFSAKDVIRIINDHLTGNEQVEVVLSVCKGIKIAIFDGKPLLVPITSEEEAIEEVDLVEVAIDLILLLFGR